MHVLQQQTLLAIAGVTMLAAGCSLQGLDDFPLGPCDTSDECEVLNLQEGVPASCRVFVCRREEGASPDEPGTCQRVAAGDEVCDGTDNDCDGVVDEASSDGAVLAPPDQERELSSSPAIFFASDGDSTERGYWQGASVPTTALVSTPEVSTPIVHRTPANPASDTNPSLGNGCWRRASTGDSLSTCEVQSMSVSLSPLGPVSAFINGQGCPNGQLRFALGDSAAPQNLVEMGDERRTNTFRGLLPASTSACSANTRQACVDAIAGTGSIENECGVSRVNLEMSGDQGVAAFLSVGARDGCGSAEDIDVMAFGVFARLSQGTVNDRIEVSGEGTPEVIGQTRGRARPSIQSLGGNLGMLLGHTNLAGNLALTHIPEQPAPPANDGSYADDDAGFMRSQAEIPPLTGVTAIGEVDLGGEATDATFAIGRARTGELRGAVAWRTSCDDTGSLRVMGFVLSESTDGVPTGIASMGTVSTVDTATGIGVPEVVRLGNGILVDPNQMAARVTRGGFIIAAYIESKDHIRIARLADDEEEVLSGDGVVVIPTSRVNDMSLVNTGQGIGVRAATTTGVLAAPITCSPDA